MSYKYIKRPGGLGGFNYIGPDQPWTRKNAGKYITDASRRCPGNWRSYLWVSDIDVSTAPWNIVVVDHEITRDPRCYFTGRIKESEKIKPFIRRAEWCCPAPEDKDRIGIKKFTDDVEYQQALALCELMTHPYSGSTYPTYPRWIAKDTYAGLTCHRTEMETDEHTVFCCPEQVDITEITLPDNMYVNISDIPQYAEDVAREAAEHETAVQQAGMERRQQVVLSMGPQPTFLERYWLPMVLVAGAIVTGIGAGIIKKRMSRNPEYETLVGSGSIFNMTEKDVESCNCCG